MKVPLILGAYSARGIIANAQRCINLFPELNPQDAPFPTTHYPASGLRVFADYSAAFPGQYVRGLYWSSRGTLYAAIGTSLLHINTDGGYTYVGSLGADSGNPVKMSDNGTTLFVVDGQHIAPGGTGPSAGGWTVNLANDAFAAITDPGFYGSNQIDFTDTFMILHWPTTPTFYTTLSNTTTFDPTYFAEKISYNDNLIAIACLQDNIWLLGAVTSEVWFNAGAQFFPFQRMPNSILQQGCVAPYSVTIADNAVFWLSQDRWGRNMLLRGQGYRAERVSTFAVENEWANYRTTINTIGMVYQQGGHEVVLLYFRDNNTSWAYDTMTKLWFQRCYGPNLDAWLPFCSTFWGTLWGYTDENLSIAGDRSSARLLIIDRHALDDVGEPITRIRSWPHLLNDWKRTAHRDFTAALQPGQLAPDLVQLRWSDDGGQTWGNYVPQNVSGAGWPTTYGQYSWSRLGYARDRVYELSWTARGETALNGAWVEVEASDS